MWEVGLGRFGSGRTAAATWCGRSDGAIRFELVAGPAHPGAAGRRADRRARRPCSRACWWTPTPRPNAPPASGSSPSRRPWPTAPSVLAAVTATYPAGQEITGPSAAMQPYAEAMSRPTTNADFVVIMTPDGVRYTHPTPAEIGRTYLGNRDAALAGGVGIETYTGTLGPSVRAIVPVEHNGQVVALVAVGVTVDHINELTNRRLLVLGLIALGALLVGVVGSLMIARWVRRQTLGMGPRELAELFTYYDAVLASVHEGMVLLDGNGPDRQRQRRGPAAARPDRRRDRPDRRRGRPARRTWRR